ncbi:bacteriocin [Lactococcus piscium]|uniref:Bacteriocin n=1 Tax=Pseudolactococcus paracarnosus TaxID=2749962 RepID=A0A7L4W9S5_9LACT|nr:bacteriocin [Lactococcus paracarnosus]MBR3138909.1 bacteriocin [Candidatus Saccharibacteria bacterium]MCJ1993176.1 bacteriocin [Lactococcus paracarnosus]QDJ27108.1 bacteriocin [Lactococcus paracarnosus]
MNRDDVITLSDGQTATVIRGDESYLKNSYVVLLNDGQSRVVDKKTLTLVRTK